MYITFSVSFTADAMSMGPSQGSNMQPSSNDSSQNWFDSDPGFFESMEGIMENLKYEFEDRFYDLNISARNDNMTEFLHKKINESMNELFDELMEKNMSAMNSSDFKGIFREMVNDSNEMMLMDLKHMNTAQMNFTEFKNMFGQLKNATSQLMIGGIRDMNISAMYDRFYQQMGNYSMSYSFSMTPPVGGPAGSGKGPGTTDAPLPPGQTDRVTQRNNGVTDRVTQKDNSGKQTTRRPGNVVTDGPQQRTTTTQANQNLPGKCHINIIEPWHGISNNVICATSKASDQPAHTRSLIRAFACRLSMLLTEHNLEFLSIKGDCTGLSESTHVKMPRCWKSHVTAHIF